VIYTPDDPVYYKINQTRKKRSVNKRQRKTSHNDPSGYKCVDSGVSTGSSYDNNKSSDSGSENNSSNGGGSGSGGGGFYRKGGAGGGHGRDDSNGKNPFDVTDVSMEDEEKKDDEDDAKMSSKEGSSMDCCDGQEQEHSTPWEVWLYHIRVVCKKP